MSSSFKKTLYLVTFVMALIIFNDVRDGGGYYFYWALLGWLFILALSYYGDKKRNPQKGENDENNSQQSDKQDN